MIWRWYLKKLLKLNGLHIWSWYLEDHLHILVYGKTWAGSLISALKEFSNDGIINDCATRRCAAAHLMNHLFYWTLSHRGTLHAFNEPLIMCQKWSNWLSALQVILSTYGDFYRNIAAPLFDFTVRVRSECKMSSALLIDRSLLSHRWHWCFFVSTYFFLLSSAFLCHGRSFGLFEALAIMRTESFAFL